MTVVPQQYTLHCVTTGDGSYTIRVYYGNDQQICSGGVEINGLLHSINTIMIILLGIYRQSVVDHSVNQSIVIKCIHCRCYM